VYGLLDLSLNAGNITWKVIDEAYCDATSPKSIYIDVVVICSACIAEQLSMNVVN
jgi:hypothetical protein